GVLARGRARAGSAVGADAPRALPPPRHGPADLRLPLGLLRLLAVPAAVVGDAPRRRDLVPRARRRRLAQRGLASGAGPPRGAFGRSLPAAFAGGDPVMSRPPPPEPEALPAGKLALAIFVTLAIVAGSVAAARVIERHAQSARRSAPAKLGQSEIGHQFQRP